MLFMYYLNFHVLIPIPTPFSEEELEAQMTLKICYGNRASK